MPDQNDTLFSTLLQKASSIGAAPEKPPYLHEKMADLKKALITRLGSNGTLTQKLFGSDPMEPDDEPYLDQFLHPERNVFPPQPLRPTKMTDVPDIPFRRFGPLRGADQMSVVEDLKAGTNLFLGDNELDPTELAGYSGGTGLGHHTKSVGTDEKGEPYFSIYDVWDFNSPVINNTVGKMINSLGTPYAVYDRYPLEKPTTNEVGAKVYKFKNPEKW